ncbi:hypothetical protein C8R26_1246 [Nitrosomonas oligotropha]|uniref:Uncharacterized protein n=1 Tax=Nitrosomonas oligotropha TaxID=42354 RepID=A0A2T5HV34_9PROT|nr:hypothetical protein C8R26_1246 [Nitrosomonas oligotropha]
MIKCKVKVITKDFRYHYSGIFQSTWHAMVDAAAKVTNPVRLITVQVIR